MKKANFKLKDITDKFASSQHVSLDFIFKRSDYGCIKLAVWRHRDFTNKIKNRSYGWTMNNGMYGSNLNCASGDVKKIVDGIMKHDTTEFILLINNNSNVFEDDAFSALDLFNITNNSSFTFL